MGNHEGREGVHGVELVLPSPRLRVVRDVLEPHFRRLVRWPDSPVQREAALEQESREPGGYLVEGLDVSKP
eukprot:980468-Heterocapsa_arctica.AAC.1